MKTTDPKLAKFLGDRIRTMTDEQLCDLVREFYRIPKPNPEPALPPLPTVAPPWTVWGVAGRGLYELAKLTGRGAAWTFRKLFTNRKGG